ncbi:mannose-1-phosphate guanylyltransferase/mannose-6-phosphate isomerase [Methanogenium sp. S4BF]|uniref:mannose-1-phosphate guanylyltransferase/mannose-6-phosphate isomerase n=1 Tax=Methanogenium sp. S4BF TaxID=1789226 RepID=UPI002415B92D|nr:mannose-1-phosphate guanylyltransferase/mannose-6-phosphate isomerase [Methanogenium sp. S4BF]WFN34996.1 mannose-1-phosphate guanylyltransferase/mannose-6-phosphate isomerase [Methanogenium sp. S4BF]
MKTLILAGGSGTRLFPLSRACYPKQFIPLIDADSLFQKSVKRALLFSEPDEITIVTNKLHRFLVADQLEEMHTPCRILSEPQGKNTLPAITYGITSILKEDTDARVAIMSSDQLINPDDSYKAAFLAAEKLAEKYLVTFGITPDSPHTGYGYIRPGACLDGGFAVDAFVEKPDLQTAESYLRDGYLWNAGMFLFSASLFMTECKKHAPEVAEAFTLPKEGAFEQTPKISVDYGIMEKTDKAAVVPLSVPWSDVGSFGALYAVHSRGEDGNAVRGEYLGIESHDNLIISDRLVATIGINDLAIIDSPDALLVCPRSESQRVGEISDLLRKRGDERCELHTTVHRPWGTYSVLQRGDTFQIKRITVTPGRRISLQLHHHRSEHWVVVKGTALVANNGNEFFVRPGESTFVPAGVRHRLENPGLLPLEVIEVQNGEYVGEDDIVRFDDDFERE